jgi:hypothetical protein
VLRGTSKVRGSLVGFQMMFHACGSALDKCPRILRGTGRAMKQPQHGRDLRQVFAAKVVTFSPSRHRHGFYVTPKEMTELINCRPQIFGQAVFQQSAENPFLLTGA